MVEFTMLVPIFLLLVLAIVDFGMGFHAWITITNSAREGARLGAVGGPSAGAVDCDPLPASGTIERRVCDTASSLNPSNFSLTVTNAQGTPGTSVVVDVDYDYSLITPLSAIMGLISGGSIGPTLTLSSTADMRLE